MFVKNDQSIRQWAEETPGAGGVCICLGATPLCIKPSYGEEKDMHVDDSDDSYRIWNKS